MADHPDGNEVQRERSESRLRSMAFDEMARVLESVGIDIKSSDGRRELRTRLDYLDRLYEDQVSNRSVLDWGREMMAMQPSPRTVMEWARTKISNEGINRDAVRKTLIEKLAGGVVWLLVGGLGFVGAQLIAKGHFP